MRNTLIACKHTGWVAIVFTLIMLLVSYNKGKCQMSLYREVPDPIENAEKLFIQSWNIYSLQCIKDSIQHKGHNTKVSCNYYYTDKWKCSNVKHWSFFYVKTKPTFEGWIQYLKRKH